MNNIAFFAPSASDAAVGRRIVSMQASGFDVTALTMHRGDAVNLPCPNIDLGSVRDGDFTGRIGAIRAAIPNALKQAETLERADVFYARNLDMLIIAARVMDKLSRPRPLVYECLDVHQLMTGRGPVAFSLRRIERRLLLRTALLVYSSPAFEEHYFRRFHRRMYRPYLLENRFVGGDSLPPRPSGRAGCFNRLKIGWVGILRCRRSLNVLCAIAEQFRGQIKVELHGKPSQATLPDFDEIVSRNEHISFHGPYRYPQDLGRVYRDMDIVWAGDWFQPGFNSTWLLPNRIYEGGYFAVPAVAPAETETARWISQRQAGFVIDEPVEKTLPLLVAQLLADKSKIRERVDALMDLPHETFVEPGGELRRLVDSIHGKSLGAGCNARE